nr:hypothetical protein [Tanacetum cinerariifolium]
MRNTAYVRVTLFVDTNTIAVMFQCLTALWTWWYSRVIDCRITRSYLNDVAISPNFANNFEVLKLLENSVEVLKILENKLESMKILENKLDSLKLQEKQPVKDKQEMDKIKSKPDKNGKRNVEDKILVPKILKNYVRCAKCGHSVNGSYCQGCALLREKLEEDLVTYLKYFQDTFESSNDNTNVINAPREPFVVKQDHGVKSSQNSLHIDGCCCECGNALDEIYCQQCILPCVLKPNFVDESSNIFNPPPQPPIYYCEFCGSNAQYGHYCTPQAPFINPKPGYSQDFNFSQNIHDFQQQYLCCDQCGGPHETFQYQQKKEEDKRIEEEQAASAQYWKIPACCDDDDDYNSAITLVLSTEEPDNSISMGDEHLDTVPATESNEVIKSSVEDLVPIPSESKGIPDIMCDVHLVNNPTPLEAKGHLEIVINSNDDIYSSDDDSLYKENIEYVEASPHDSELVSLEAAEIVIPKVKEIEDDNLQISSGSTTTQSDISLPGYEAFSFYEDHIKEISSGSTNTHYDISLSEYDSFVFDPSNDQFPPTDRSALTHEEFADELAHIVSSPEYNFSTFGIYPIQLSSIPENLKTLAKGFYPLSLRFLGFN